MCRLLILAALPLLFAGTSAPKKPPRVVRIYTGCVLENFRHLPETGEIFTLKRWRFEIVDMDGRKVDKVLASPVRSAAGPVHG